MAGRFFQVQLSTPVALTTGVKTMLQIRPPTDMPIVIREVRATLRDATTAVQPVFRFLMQTQSGTPTATVTPVQWGTVVGTIQSTCRENFTAEPTTTRILAPEVVLPPQGGIISRDPMLIEPGAAFGLAVLQQTTATGTLYLGIRAEE